MCVSWCCSDVNYVVEQAKFSCVNLVCLQRGWKPTKILFSGTETMVIRKATRSWQFILVWRNSHWTSERVGKPISNCQLATNPLLHFNYFSPCCLARRCLVLEKILSPEKDCDENLIKKLSEAQRQRFSRSSNRSLPAVLSAFRVNWSNVSHPRLQSIQSFPLKSNHQLLNYLSRLTHNWQVLWSQRTGSVCENWIFISCGRNSSRAVVEGLEDLISYLNKRRVCWHCKNTFRIFASRSALGRVIYATQSVRCLRLKSNSMLFYNPTACTWAWEKQVHPFFTGKTSAPDRPGKIGRKQFRKGF